MSPAFAGWIGSKDSLSLVEEANSQAFSLKHRMTAKKTRAQAKKRPPPLLRAWPGSQMATEKPTLSPVPSPGFGSFARQEPCPLYWHTSLAASQNDLRATPPSNPTSPSAFANSLGRWTTLEADYRAHSVASTSSLKRTTCPMDSSSPIRQVSFTSPMSDHQTQEAIVSQSLLPSKRPS